ncbi:MAG: hypothetical protein Q4A65_08265 [Bacillota bacterium]|nr:hypothetical protein [Bacillota bacterium]
MSDKKYEKSNWTYKKVHRFAEKYGLDYSSADKKIVNAIEEKYPKKTREEKAALFAVIKPTDENPYGKIGDYSVDGDSGYKSGGRRWGRRRGYGHGGWGSGGGGGGGGGASSFTPEVNTAGKKAKVTDLTIKSNLNDAYRKKLKKLREQNRKVK